MTRPVLTFSPAALGWILGLFGPALGLAALAAGLMAASHAPLNDLTGIGRWTLAGPFAMAAMALGMWVMAGPTTAVLYLGLRRLGWRRALPATAGAALLGLATLSAWLAVGGPGGPSFRGELARWLLLWTPACIGCTLWLHLCLVGLRRLAGRGRRAPSADPEETAP
ncbi:MAG: hypothetical protein AAFU61_12925 [Pseudomonadota bacterium]